MANNSVFIKANGLKLEELTKFSTSAYHLKLICEQDDALFQLTCMLMRQKVNNDVSKDSLYTGLYESLITCGSLVTS